MKGQNKGRKNFLIFEGVKFLMCFAQCRCSLMPGWSPRWPWRETRGNPFPAIFPRWTFFDHFRPFPAILAMVFLATSTTVTWNARKSISYQVTAATLFLPFSAILIIACLTTSTTVTGNTRKSISYQITAATHFLLFPAISCHFLPGYRIVHNKKRAETHDCQFRQISAMLTWLPL